MSFGPLFGDVRGLGLRDSPMATPAGAVGARSQLPDHGPSALRPCATSLRCVWDRVYM